MKINFTTATKYQYLPPSGRRETPTVNRRYQPNGLLSLHVIRQWVGAEVRGAEGGWGWIAASTRTWQTTQGTLVGAHVLSHSTLTIGLVPHEILSPRGEVVLRLKILKAISPLIFTPE